METLLARRVVLLKDWCLLGDEMLFGKFYIFNLWIWISSYKMANNQHSRYFGILSGKTQTYFKLALNNNAWDLRALFTCGLQADFVIMQWENECRWAYSKTFWCSWQPCFHFVIACALMRPVYLHTTNVIICHR